MGFFLLLFFKFTRETGFYRIAVIGIPIEYGEIMEEKRKSGPLSSNRMVSAFLL